MIKRHIEPAISALVGKFPVLTITGPRQSGKTTLIRFFWRGNAQHEIDLLLNVGGQLRPIEIKSGTTYQNDYFKPLDWFSKTADVPLFQPTVIYGGEDTQPIGDHCLMSWREVGSLVA